MPIPLTIPLDVRTAQWVEESARGLGFDNPAVFVRSLLVRERRRARLPLAFKKQTAGQIEERLLDAIRSGGGLEASPAFWRRVKTEGARRGRAARVHRKSA